MSEEFPDEKKSYSQLIKQHQDFRSLKVDEIEKFYNERKSAIESAVKEKNFEKSLALFTCKSVLDICKTIVNNYKNKIIGALGEEKEVRNKLINKYFKEIADFIQKPK